MGDLQGAPMSRQNTVNMTDPLPDIDFFSYPVDDLFDSYISELGLGARGQTPSGGISSFVPPDTSSKAFALPGGHLSNGYQSSASVAPFMPVPQPGSDLLQAVPDLGQGLLPDLPDLNTARNSFAQAMGLPEHRETGTSSLQAHDIHDGPSYGLPLSNGGTSKSKRNPRQQQQNKAAQQRYRERRKQRFSDMEQVIDDLSSQLKRMSEISSQNAMLQNHVQMLQQMLKDRDADIRALRQKVQPDASAELSRGQRNHIEDARQAQRQIDNLRQLMDAHKLWEAESSGAGVDARILKQLSDGVAAACESCQRFAAAQGIQVLEWINADQSTLHNVQGCSVKWGTVIQALRLSAEQQEQLLLMRQNHLKQLKEVYTQRQALNQQAVSLMAPAELADDTDAVERKLHCMSIKGYRHCNPSVVDLDKTLNAIKETLRAEQKRVVELNLVAVFRVMSPIQAAAYLIMKFPEHGTMLDMLNVLATQLGRNDSSGDQGSIKAASSGDQASGRVDYKAEGPCPLLTKEEPDKDAHEVQADSGSSAYTAGLGMPHNLPQLT